MKLDAWLWTTIVGIVLVVLLGLLLDQDPGGPSPTLRSAPTMSRGAPSGAGLRPPQRDTARQGEPNAERRRQLLQRVLEEARKLRQQDQARAPETAKRAAMVRALLKARDGEPLTPEEEQALQRYRRLRRLGDRAEQQFENDVNGVTDLEERVERLEQRQNCLSALRYAYSPNELAYICP